MRKRWTLFLSVICLCSTAYTLALRTLKDSVPVDSEENFCIVVDAGHGGIDGGVTGIRTGVKESDLNLSIAFTLKEVFEDAGFEVVMTRKTSFGLFEEGGKWYKSEDMKKRREIIEKADPDVVISVHQNYYPASASPRGGQVFYSKESETGKRLAVEIQKNVNALYGLSGVKDRVATAANYYMLECTSAPSVIVECGFLSNPDDEALLSTESYRKKLSKSIFSGVMQYYSSLCGGVETPHFLQESE